MALSNTTQNYAKLIAELNAEKRELRMRVLELTAENAACKKRINIIKKASQTVVVGASKAWMNLHFMEAYSVGQWAGGSNGECLCLHFDCVLVKQFKSKNCCFNQFCDVADIVIARMGSATPKTAAPPNCRNRVNGARDSQSAMQIGKTGKTQLRDFECVAVGWFCYEFYIADKETVAKPAASPSLKQPQLAAEQATPAVTETRKMKKLSVALVPLVFTGGKTGPMQQTPQIKKAASDVPSSKLQLSFLPNSPFPMRLSPNEQTK